MNYQQGSHLAITLWALYKFFLHNIHTMAASKLSIRRFQSINALFEATGFQKRTDIPDFFIFRFDELPKDNALSMPPYQKDFLQISLIMQAGNASADINTQSNHTLENTLYFLSPDHIFSWQRNQRTTGYVVYFHSAFLAFFSGNFGIEFSFFALSQQNFLQLNPVLTASFSAHFGALYQEYYLTGTQRVQILQCLLLALLYKCKSLHDTVQPAHPTPGRKQALAFQFQNLLSNCYLTHKQVGDYAQLLAVSIPTLNQSIKEVLGKTPKTLIAEKLIQEAKKKLKYTPDDVAQIAYAMGYEEPTHFIRFFKSQTMLTPREYRNAPL